MSQHLDSNLNVSDLNKKMTTTNAVATQQIASGSDLNNYKDGGTYLIPFDSVASQISNTPRGASGRLVVIQRTSVYSTQLYLPSTSAEMIYIRNYNNGTWSDWKELLNNGYSAVDATKVGTLWTGGSVRAHRKGCVVTLKFGATVFGASVSSRTQFGTIPAGYRPISDVMMRSDDSTGTHNCQIGSDGTLKAEPQSAGTFWGAVTYLCDR